ncbi:L10-interacting MYB domain-containing protein isoform X1 [Cynara cardunculus var. scolymus]|uniref:L10-interacting MYB domain-containing protein isoform X1 n=2 Tax=Cynara cardunculus var. scolymus TaxID=59895 RepID=UPI000D62906C|nr:L10-interacting MYB domain-containing protein isoform X1 [Cynara cardunculus var. scolymus]
MEMGIRHQKNSDRLRTIWTPEMDRYFIDLMLEQVGKGNRIDDHLFSKRAWKNMMLLFNTKFKFHYEKDVLKNRHKTLRNLYRAINNLLSMNGFSWDQTRQMVTADNNVWDDYIKVHPDARSYRIKTIPYYYDLCQIYKNISTEGNLDTSDENPERDCKALGTEGEDCLVKSLSGSVGDAILENETGNADEADLEALHEIMIDEDFRVSISKEFADGIPQSEEDMGLTSGRTRARTYWQPPMDRYFIDLMVDQVQKGNQIDGLFRKQAWIDMIKSFNARFGFKYDVDILKNRYKTFKRQYNTIKKLLESEGFFWDDLRQMVIADDRAWQDYIEANSDARQYMTRPVPYYKDLCIVCKEVNTSDGRESLSDNHSNQKDEAGILKQTHSATVSDEQESPHLDLKRKLENRWSSEHLKKARMDEESMASALREMATAVSCLADKMKNEDDDDDDDDNSSKLIAVVKAIQGLPDMDEDLILDACDFLEDDDKKAKTFLALDVKLRRKWLIRKLRPQHSSIQVKPTQL